MTIPEILTKIRDRRVCYGKHDDFTIPLKWERTPYKTFANISKDHAKMIVAASGKEFTPHAIYIPNHDDFLGIGNASVTVLPSINGSYLLRHERHDLKSPLVLPTSIDLSHKLKPPEDPQDRPTEMIPEDYYM